MTATVRGWFASASEMLASFQAQAELSRFSDARLRDLSVERDSLGVPTSAVPWQVAEQGGTGAKVHRHVGVAV